MSCSLQAIKKKQLVQEGKLGKFGKILDSTPDSVKAEFGTAGEATTAAAATVKKEPVVESAGVETLTAIAGTEKVKKAPVDMETAVSGTKKKVKKEPVDVEVLAAVTTATPTTVALSAKRKVHICKLCRNTDFSHALLLNAAMLSK